VKIDVSELRVTPLQTSDRNSVESFVKSHWGSEIVVAKGRVTRPAELDGFAFSMEKSDLVC